MPIVVGTIDQALMSVVRVPHAHMRACASARLTLILDEFHASDARLHAFADELLTRHVALGGHAIIMLATVIDVASRMQRRITEMLENHDLYPLSEPDYAVPAILYGNPRCALESGPGLELPAPWAEK